MDKIDVNFDLCCTNMLVKKPYKYLMSCFDKNNLLEKRLNQSLSDGCIVVGNCLSFY